jgi:ABC-2 type transport system ATP-binding protein
MSISEEKTAAPNENSENRTALLRVEHLSKIFSGFQALCDVSFGLSERDILGIIGPNGAGKTTLLECLTGLLPVSSGLVLWKTHSLPVHKRKDLMFYLPQDIAPYSEQPAFRLTGLHRDVYNLSREREHEVFVRLKLQNVLSRRVGELSRGYRRRLLLALALLTPKPLLLLDEPFDGLDPRQTVEVADLLREESAAGRTLVLSVHQLADAARICSRYLLLVEGKIVGCGTMEELRTQAGVESTNLEAIFFALT